MATVKLSKAQLDVLRQVADGSRVFMVGGVSGNVYVKSREVTPDFERVNKATFYALFAYRPVPLREVQGERGWKLFEITDAGRVVARTGQANR